MGGGARAGNCRQIRKKWAEPLFSCSSARAMLMYSSCIRVEKGVFSHTFLHLSVAAT